MWELSLVNQVLTEYEKYGSHGNGLSRDIDAVRNCMHSLLTMLGGAARGDEFQISKNTFITLYKVLIAKNNSDIVLTAEEKQTFKVLDFMFGDPQFFAILCGLHLLIANSVFMRNAVIQMQHVFSGRCIGLAAKYDVSVNNRFLSFQTRARAEGEGKNNELKVLEEKAQEAQIISRQVGDLCVRYRICS